MKRYLVSFADSRMKKALLRLRRQAEEINFFDSIILLTEHELDADFLKRFEHLLSPQVRGFGYWLWKPYIIKTLLDTLETDDELYYLDAGCHINPRGRNRMLDYAQALKESKTGIVAFKLGDWCSELRFSKMDLLQHMNVHKSPHITETGQICATHVFCRKNSKSTAFLNEWLNTCYNLHLIDDSPSAATNHPAFIEHRHDQSVFSILGKLNRITTLPGNETWPANNTRDWSTMNNYPIWDKRDLGWNTHLLYRAIRKVKKLLQKFRKN